MEDLSIALSCMRSEAGDITGNLDSMLRRIREAERLGADLIVFPELSLTGYSMSPGGFCSIERDSPEIGILERASAGIAVCFGYADKEGYIVQAIAEGGKTAGEYRKTHLGEAEAARMKPGDSLDIIHTRKADIGIQLCWESHFPDITRTYAVEGADLVLMPTASGLSPERRIDVWSRILPARAYDNSVYVAAVNASGGNGHGVEFGGCAMALDPSGRVISGDSSGKDVTVTAEMLAEPLETIRNGNGYSTMRNVHYLAGRRPELYRD